MCRTKYPLLLVHGLGFRDSFPLSYWGRIPKVLRQKGAQVYFGQQDSNGSVESNARFLYRRVLEVLEETGAQKVNIIAHSKGGLDARWMITHLDKGEHVASLTTLSTPHHGSRTVDRLLRFPDILVRFTACCCNVWYRILGDTDPDTYGVFHTLTTRQAAEFNENTPDMPSVYYQSYGFIMQRAVSDLLMWLPYLVVKWVEGPNDGLVTAESAAWGDFRGVFTGTGRRGVSHCDAVDRSRRPLSRYGEEVPGRIRDMTEFYSRLVEELKEKGF